MKLKMLFCLAAYGMAFACGPNVSPEPPPGVPEDPDGSVVLDTATPAPGSLIIMPDAGTPTDVSTSPTDSGTPGTDGGTTDAGTEVDEGTPDSGTSEPGDTDDNADCSCSKPGHGQGTGHCKTQHQTNSQGHGNGHCKYDCES